jgi:uncharacterized protein (TIGR00251 family)
MTADFLHAQGENVVVALRIQPRASRTEVGEPLGAELKVRVAAPPVDDAANEELLRFLARQLDCPRSRLRLLRGRTSRHKQIAVAGLSLDAVRSRLLG